jgi:hypothetical protein
MKQPKKRGHNLPESLKQSKINGLEKSFDMLVEMGPEKWTQNYTLSHTDKLHQLDQMKDHFQTLEEYEKCQYILDVKKSIDTHRFML